MYLMAGINVRKYVSRRTKCYRNGVNGRNKNSDSMCSVLTVIHSYSQGHQSVGTTGFPVWSLGPPIEIMKSRRKGDLNRRGGGGSNYWIWFPIVPIRFSSPPHQLSAAGGGNYRGSDPVNAILLLSRFSFLLRPRTLCVLPWSPSPFPQHWHGNRQTALRHKSLG